MLYFIVGLIVGLVVGYLCGYAVGYDDYEEEIWGPIDY